MKGRWCGQIEAQRRNVIGILILSAGISDHHFEHAIAFLAAKIDQRVHVAIEKPPIDLIAVILGPGQKEEIDFFNTGQESLA